LGTKALNRHFSKEKMQMTNKYMKKVTILLAIRIMQIQTIWKYHFILLRMTIIKNKYMKNPCKDVRKRSSHTLLVGMQISTAIMENSMDFPQKN
jgi:hypothetical protein